MTSAHLSPEPHEPTPVTGRTYGYVRASIIKDVESPEAQADIIATHCHRIGRRLDEVFFDDAPSGSLSLSSARVGRGSCWTSARVIMSSWREWTGCSAHSSSSPRRSTAGVSRV